MTENQGKHSMTENQGKHIKFTFILVKFDELFQDFIQILKDLGIDLVYGESCLPCFAILYIKQNGQGFSAN